MKKLISMLLMGAIVFSLAATVLAQTAGAANVTSMENLANKKKKHHKKKKHPTAAKGNGSREGVMASSITSVPQIA
jgi:FlaG/FlaF family flagellin (archaellin)